MILDSSALVAIILHEVSAPRLLGEAKRASPLRMSAASFVETSIVMARRSGQGGMTDVDDALEQLDVSVEPVTIEHAHGARDAYLRFGKGRHPAALNFGDCFSYALARHHDEPLLFVGGDFARTDVRSATA